MQLYNYFVCFLFQLTAIEKKIITEKEIRDSIKPLFMTRMRLGEFDPPEMNPYTKVRVCCTVI